jgi:hypothetical protein
MPKKRGNRAAHSVKGNAQEQARHGDVSSEVPRAKEETLTGIAAQRRPVGRPKGEASIVINVRLPVSLLERFNRYLDRREQGTWEVVNRGMVIRELLEALLEEEGL